MNHIKKYKLFESAELLVPGEIKDILLEITDIGYVCFVQSGWWSNDSHGSVRVVIKGRPKVYKKNPREKRSMISRDEYTETKNIIVFGEVLETMLRLKDYLAGFGYYPNLDTVSRIDFFKKFPEKSSIIDEYNFAFTTI